MDKIVYFMQDSFFKDVFEISNIGHYFGQMSRLRDKLHERLHECHETKWRIFWIVYS
jgi:hypothetical protein